MSIAEHMRLPAARARGRRWFDFGKATASRLFRRYFVVMALCTCGILLPAIAVQTVKDYFEDIGTIKRVQTIQANAAASQVASSIFAIESQVREVAALPWGRNGLGEADRRAEFHRLLKRVPAILEIARYDSQGRETLYVSRVNEDRWNGATGPALPANERVPGDTIAFSPVEFRDSLEPFVRSTVREGPFGDGGWVRVLVDLKHVAEAIGAISVPGGGTAYLVDTTGTVIAHPRAEFMLRRTAVSDPQIRDFATTPASRKETVAAIDTMSMDGKATYSSMAYIGEPPWTIVIEQPADVVTAPLRRSLLGALLILVIALALSFVVSHSYAQRLSRPILALEAVAADFGKGNFRNRIEVRTGDEIELLAGELNRMADQLQEYTDSLERKVAEKTAELEAANRHKSEFLANMSHELRTPLNAVIGFSEVLKERMFGELNAKQMEYVRDIYSSGQHLLSLINDILDLSKVEAGRMELDIHEFDVHAAIANCCTLIRERAQRQRLRLDSEVDEGVGYWPADERKFKQVVLNLLSNAVKFTPAGGEVRVRARVDRDWLCVRVIDTGIGIAPHERAAIFEEFHQVRTPGGPKHEGTGLGLSLSRRLIELHGGTLTVESEPDRGSTFTARFPRRPGHA